MPVLCSCPYGAARKPHLLHARPVSLSVWRGARRARGAPRDITRGAGKSKGLGQGGTAEPGSAEPGIVYLRTLDCLQQGNKKVGGKIKTWDECNGSSARLGVRGRARVRVLESEVEDGFESKFEFEFESSRSSSSCRVRVRVRGPEFELPRSSSRLS